MKLLVKPVGEEPKLWEVKKIDLDVMKEVIGGGYVQCVPLGAWYPKLEGIDCWMDEEGKLQAGWVAKINFSLLHPETEEVHDVVVGNSFFTVTDEEGDALPLSDEQVKLVCEVLKWKSPC